MSVTTDRVPNARLRQEFLRLRRAGHLDANLVAIRLGWMHADGRADTTRVLRVLGLSRWAGGKTSKGYLMKNVDRQRAVEMAEALGLDPVDVDL